MLSTLNVAGLFTFTTLVKGRMLKSGFFWLECLGTQGEMAQSGGVRIRLLDKGFKMICIAEHSYAISVKGRGVAFHAAQSQSVHLTESGIGAARC